jgi:hypothetical protein
MRKLFFGNLAAVLLAAGMLPAAIPALADGNGAQTSTFTGNFNDFNSCNGDPVILTGTDHRERLNRDDGSFQLNVEIYAANDAYVLDINNHEQFGAGSTTFSITEREVLVSKGSQPNQLVDVTISSDGTTIQSECVG